MADFLFGQLEFNDAILYTLYNLQVICSAKIRRCCGGRLMNMIWAYAKVVLIILGLNLVVLLFWWIDFHEPSRFTKHKKPEKVTNNEKAEKRAEEEASRKRVNLFWLIILLVLLNISIVYALIEWG